MWAQSWGNVAKHVLPFPDAPAIDSTTEMIKQVINLLNLFFQLCTN